MRPANANISLTRRCNLRCDTCRLVHDYSGSPYIRISDYQEASASQWMNTIDEVNPVFTCLYGGEPLLYKELPELTEFLNYAGRYYTVITNGILIERYLKKCTKSQIPYGLSMSFDGFGSQNSDYQYKSNVAYRFFSEKLHEKFDIQDPLVIFTAGMHNFRDFERTVKYFTELGVFVELTILDYPKTEFYDFAEGSPITKNPELDSLFDVARRLKNSGYLVHNSLDAIYLLKKHYDGSYICDSPWNSLTIDPDMSPRLCLRIKGIETPKCNINDKESILSAMKVDQSKICRGCSWNCAMACDLVASSGTSLQDIVFHGGI